MRDELSRSSSANGSDVSRRAVVGAIAAACGSVALALVPGDRAFAHTASAGPHDAPAALAGFDERALVPSADGAVMSTPAVLGLRVSPADALRGGWRLGLEWDARLYTTYPTLDVCRVGESDVLESIPLPRVTLTGDRAGIELPVPHTVKSGEACELMVGAYTARAYPDDLTENPVPTAGRLFRGRTEVASVALSEVLTGPVPWGATMGVEWVNDESGTSVHPGFIVLTSVGPGAVPRGSSVHIDVSAAGVGGLSVTDVRTADEASFPGESRSSAAGSRRFLDWTLHSPLPPDASVYLAVDGVMTGARQNPGDGPLVAFLAPQGALARAARLTRTESAIPE